VVEIVHKRKIDACEENVTLRKAWKTLRLFLYRSQFVLLVGGNPGRSVI
jgi:hypothetical protein